MTGPPNASPRTMYFFDASTTARPGAGSSNVNGPAVVGVVGDSLS